MTGSQAHNSLFADIPHLRHHLPAKVFRMLSPPATQGALIIVLGSLLDRSISENIGRHGCRKQSSTLVQMVDALHHISDQAMSDASKGLLSGKTYLFCTFLTFRLGACCFCCC